MSDKLTAYKGDVYIPVYGSIADAQVYLKSEADKVIADLEESHKKEVEQLLIEIEELKHSLELASNECCSISERGVKNARHHKYKRCLAMAEWCDAEVRNIRRKPLCDMDDHEGWQHDDEFWQRWHKRWLELAEKFKEAK